MGANGLTSLNVLHVSFISSFASSQSHRYTHKSQIMFFKFALYLTFLVSFACAHPNQLRPRQASQGCRPLHTTFSHSEVSNGGNTLITMISPADSYSTTANGLELYLKRPAKKVTTHNGVNDQLGSGATANSSFLLRYAYFDLNAWESCMTHSGLNTIAMAK